MLEVSLPSEVSIMASCCSEATRPPFSFPWVVAVVTNGRSVPDPVWRELVPSWTDSRDFEYGGLKERGLGRVRWFSELDRGLFCWNKNA